MSLSHRIAFAAAAAWFSRGVSIVLGLVLMPLLFRHLPARELGVWLLLGQSWAALGIFDLGFGVTLTRRIAFAKARCGPDPATPLHQRSLAEVADLVATGRAVYRCLALFAFLFSFAAGCFYLHTLDLQGVGLPRAACAWTFLCLAQAAGVWAAVWTCLLQGAGYVGWDAILASCVTVLVLAAQILAACCGGGLMALAAIAAAGAILQRFLILGAARHTNPALFNLRGRWNGPAFRGMISLALRAWVTSLGFVLVGQTDSALIASSKGAAAVPAWRAAFLVCINLNMLALALSGASSVFLSQLWRSNNLAQLQRLVLQNTKLALAFMACALAFLLGAGPLFFDLWLGPGHFVGHAILAAFALTQFLEVQAQSIATSSRATEDEAFALSSIAAGLLKLALALLLIPTLGLLGLALSTLIALAASNHWYMPARGLRRLQLPLAAYLKTVLAPSLALFAITWTPVYLVANSFPAWPNVLKLALTALFPAALFSAAAWFSIFNRSKRSEQRSDNNQIQSREKLLVTSR